MEMEVQASQKEEYIQDGEYDIRNRAVHAGSPLLLCDFSRFSQIPAQHNPRTAASTLSSHVVSARDLQRLLMCTAGFLRSGLSGP